MRKSLTSTKPAVSQGEQLNGSVDKFVSNVRRTANNLPADKLLTANSQLFLRLVHDQALVTFLFGWFEMGLSAQGLPDKDMASLVKGNKATPLKKWCMVAYLSGFVNRTWTETLRVLACL